MSHAPLEASEDSTSDLTAAFLRANDRQNELVRAGVSQSGHERNCCFLNTGAERFANVSAAAGLDHIGDARAYALVDWDDDGDLDLWTTNRTAPRVQFLRNNSGSDHHFLALKLEGNGTTTNRDAIGARVEVLLVGDQRPMIKTLRAGEGFLSQSSKLVHFGLGDQEQIDRIKIRWPGGDVEQFAGLKADRTYRIVQGSDRAEMWSRPSDPVTLQASENEPPARTDMARISLRFPIPLPTLAYETFEGKQVSIDKYRGSPTLVNLWASWCQPCLAELAELRERQQEIRDKKLAVIALSIDGLAEDQQADPKAARQLLQQLKFPFEGGLATASLTERFEEVLNYLFDYRRPWSVPTSLLLDNEGHLAAIYVGRVNVDELLSDADNLRSDEQSWLEASLPFPGRWSDGKRLPDLWPFVELLFKKKKSAVAVDYFTRLEKLQAPTDTFLQLLVQVGVALREKGDLPDAGDRLRQALDIKPENDFARLQLANVYYLQGRIKEAVQQCREVLRLRPDSVDAHLGLAKLLESQGELDEAIGHYEHVLRLNPAQTEANNAVGLLYNRQQQWDKALQPLQRAILAEPTRAPAQYGLARALEKTGRLTDAIEHYQQAVRLEPDSSEYCYALGVALTETGRLPEAVPHFRHVLVQQPDSLPALNALAWVLATWGDATPTEAVEAVELAEQAANMTNHQHPRILDTLAAAYAAKGDFQRAISTAEKAVELADTGESSELAEEIRGRLAKYRSGEPYRESSQPHKE